MITEFSKSNTILNTFLSELREIHIQKDSMRFRRNLERIGEIAAYEISKTLEYKNTEFSTPLAKTSASIPCEQPVVTTILRAGLPLHQGVLNYFDKAENTFISAYRKHTEGDDFEVEIEYMSSPNVDGKTLILCDPMLASGSSMVLAYKAILKKGTPKKVHILAVVSSKEGLEFCKENLPKDVDFWIGEIDQTLNSKSYIVPGLGDAGDLAYGKKE